VETIIIFRIGSIGDTVVALPCFHRIARSFPNERRIVVTDVPASKKASSVESVLGPSGLIDGVIYFPPRPRKLRDFLDLRNRIRATKSRTLVYIADREMLSTVRDICFFRSCGISQVIGAPLKRDLRLPRVDPESGYTEREAARLARCLASLGAIDLEDPGFWDLCLQPDEMRVGDRSLASLGGNDFIAVNIGGKVPSKDWGNENWTALFRLIAAEHAGLGLVFVGSADEFDRVGELAAIWPGPTLNLCGALATRESAAALKRALLFVGHDSGPIHLAAAAGVPCVGIFGAFNRPKWWHPMGQCHSIIHNMRGVHEISPEEVHAAVRLTIAQAAKQRNRSKFSAGLEIFSSQPTSGRDRDDVFKPSAA
jgi:ADP-heptose:LPS heptosyltransferase